MHGSQNLATALLTTALLAACSEPSPTVAELSAAPLGKDAPAATVGPLAEPPPPIAVEPLTGRHVFTDEVTAQLRLKPSGRSREVVNIPDASRIAVVRFTVQPGVRFPWHTHPALVMVSVTQGKLVFVYADDCVPRLYPAGTGFVDPGFGNVHYAFNPTDGETVIVATFLGAPPAPEPLTLPVAAPVAARLDAKCGVAPAAHSH